MEFIISDIEKNLFNIIQSIKSDPASWEDWKCLQIKIPDLYKNSDNMEIRQNIKAIIHSRFSEKKCSVFFLGLKEIFLFCKLPEDPDFTEVTNSITDLFSKKDKSLIEFKIINISEEPNLIVDEYTLDDFMLSLTSISYDESFKNSLDLVENNERSHNKGSNPNLKKVLLVEDDALSRWMVRKSIKDACDLVTAQDARQAISLYQNYKPDMVILDINLPDGSGKEVLKDMLEQDPKAYIVMFSSQDTASNIADTMDKGAKGFIAKPFKKERLFEYINNCA